MSGKLSDFNQTLMNEAKDMTVRYKELPSEETNTFKADDRAVLYGNTQTGALERVPPAGVVGVVRKSLGDGWLQFRIESEPEDHTVHWKQLRKLVPVEPREWDAYVNENGKLFGSIPWKAKWPHTYIKTRVREVIE